VQQFHDSGEANRAGRALPCRVAIAKKKERRPQPLAAAAEQVARYLGNRRKRHSALAREFPFHED
jgi:hypothetical protein